MNTTPHIGTTLEQRAVLRLQREREAELSVTELMSRFQPEPANFCAQDDADETAQARHDWLLALVIGTLGAPLVWHLMGWLLPLVWSAK